MAAEIFVPEVIEHGPRRPDGRIQDKRDPRQQDLVQMDGRPVHRAAARALGALREAAHAAGFGGPPLLTVVSGYRSSSLQQRLFEAAVLKYGSAAAARVWVAPPGCSAHQSGRALDLYLGLGCDSQNAQALRGTAIHCWLVAHAHAFGFYAYEAEPWHWEYNPPPPPSEARGTLEAR